MHADAPGRLEQAFAFVIAKRWYVIAFYAVLLPASAYYAAQVGSGQLDRSADCRDTIPTTSPRATSRRSSAPASSRCSWPRPTIRLRPGGCRTRRPDRARAARRSARDDQLGAVDLSGAPRPASSRRPSRSTRSATFATGTDLFRRQGLVGDHYLAIGLILDVQRQRRAPRDAGRHRPRDGAAFVARSGAAAQLAPARPALRQRLPRRRRSARRRSTSCSSPLFVVVLNVALYRSVRTLAGVPDHARRLPGAVGRLHRCDRRHVHDRLADGADDRSWSPPPRRWSTCTRASSSARAGALGRRAPDLRADQQVRAPARRRSSPPRSGFAALVVSDIRPIREMGIWVAVGLAAHLGHRLHALPGAAEDPAHADAAGAARGAATWLDALRRPGSRGFSYRWRWPLVGRAARCSAASAASSLFGLPGVVAPMRSSPIRSSTSTTRRRSTTTSSACSRSSPGSRSRRSGSRAALGSVSEPDVLTGCTSFQQALEADPDVGAVVGPTTILRMHPLHRRAGRRLADGPGGARAAGRRPRGLVVARSRCCSASCSRTSWRRRS